MGKRHRGAFRIKGGQGFFDDRARLEKLVELGDPLARLNTVIDWEIFRTDLNVLHEKERKNLSGRKPIDAVLMFKIMILQRLNNLSDDQAEFLIRDRASFQRFLGIHVEDGSPDAKTIWKFREQLRALNLVEALFACFDAHLNEKGFAAKGGQIVDAVIVEVPRQRNTREENEEIKDGKIPEKWIEQPKKLAQKDLDARWTQKRGQNYYGYKNHINADQKHKLIRAYTVTDASIHDGPVLEDLLDLEIKDRPVFADSAYRSQAREKAFLEIGIESKIHERPYRNAPLIDEQKAANREKSRVRVRVEHIFGFQKTSMNGSAFVRSIGGLRAQSIVGLVNLTYNISRFVQLVAPRSPRGSTC